MDNKKILIVEDERVLNKTLSDFLKTENFNVFSAYDGEEGVSLAKTEIPDLILLDIILPKKNGYEVIKDLKADASTKNIPIILLTNLGGVKDIEKALELGATTYLVKSDYKMADIALKIKSVLEA